MTRLALLASTALLSPLHLGPAYAQGAASAEGEPETIAVTRLIEIVAEKTGDNFVVDPRVRADVILIGQEPAEVDYDGLLAILQVHGYAAMRGGDYVRIVPDANARSYDTPVASDTRDRPGAEIVSKVVTVQNVPAAQLVPILRPLLPQWAHLAAYSCSNTLIVVDTSANIARLEEIIRGVDVGEPYEPPSCERGVNAPGQAEAPPRGEAPQGVPRERRR